MRLHDLTEEQQRTLYEFLEDFWNLTTDNEGEPTEKSDKVKVILDLIDFENR